MKSYQLSMTTFFFVNPFFSINHRTTSNGMKLRRCNRPKNASGEMFTHKRHSRHFKKKTNAHQQVITWIACVNVRIYKSFKWCHELLSAENPSQPTHFYCYCGMRWFTKEVLVARSNRQVDLVLVDLMVNCAGNKKSNKLKEAKSKFQNRTRRHTRINPKKQK